MIIIPKKTMLKYIHQSNLIEGYDDRRMDNQSLVAWEYLIEQKRISHQVIQEVQRLITLRQNDLAPEWRGQYRDVAKLNVTVGKHTPPSFNVVRYLMDNFVLDFHKQDSILMHAKFEYIHPFVDGNGRTGRMLMWWQQALRNEKLWYIPAKNRMEYYEWLNNATKDWKI